MNGARESRLMGSFYVAFYVTHLNWVTARASSTNLYSNRFAIHEVSLMSWIVNDFSTWLHDCCNLRATKRHKELSLIWKVAITLHWAFFFQMQQVSANFYFWFWFHFLAQHFLCAFQWTWTKKFANIFEKRIALSSAPFTWRRSPSKVDFNLFETAWN